VRWRCSEARRGTLEGQQLRESRRPARGEILTKDSRTGQIMPLLESTRVENHSDRGSGCHELDAVAEAAEFPDHLARAHLLGLRADGWPPFFITHALVKDLPNQATESVGDGADRLGMSEAWDDSAIHDGEDRSLGLHRGIGGLIEDAAHLAIAFGAAVAVVDARTLLVAGTGAHPGGEVLG
jgi:hypothetical protein